jgi:hypothetical protein
MKNKTRKFKVNDKVKILWSKQSLEDHGLESLAIIRRFDNDYHGNWYYVSNPRSLVLWLIKESQLRKVSKI